MISFPPETQRRLDAIRALESQPEVLEGILLEIELMLREALDNDGERGVDREEGNA